MYMCVCVCIYMIYPSSPTLEAFDNFVGTSAIILYNEGKSS